MTRVRERDITLTDGRTLHVYETGKRSSRFPIIWHHGTPNTGAPPEPLMRAAKKAGLRWVLRSASVFFATELGRPSSR